VDGVNAQGQLEPLVGRETPSTNSQQFGQTLTTAKICWSPGARLQDSADFEIELTGEWRKMR